MCNDSNFGGKCVYFTTTYPRICYPLPADMAGKISSIRPDKNQVCRFYEGENCGGQADWLRHPGTKNMRGRRFDNKVKSFKCDDDCDEQNVQEGGCYMDGKGGWRKDGEGKWKRPTAWTGWDLMAKRDLFGMGMMGNETMEG